MIDIESIKSLERGGTYVVSFNKYVCWRDAMETLDKMSEYVKDRDIKFILDLEELFTIK